MFIRKHYHADIFYFSLSNWKFKRRKKKKKKTKDSGSELTEMSIHRGVSKERAKTKQIIFRSMFSPGQLHFIIIVYNYEPKALPPATTPAVLRSQCHRRVGARLHRCCHKANAIANNWGKGNDKPSGQIRMCNTSYPNTGVQTQLFYQHTVIIPYVYFISWQSIGA